MTTGGTAPGSVVSEPQGAPRLAPAEGNPPQDRAGAPLRARAGLSRFP